MSRTGFVDPTPAETRPNGGLDNDGETPLSRRVCGEGHRLRAECVDTEGRALTWREIVLRFRRYLADNDATRPVFSGPNGEQFTGSLTSNRYTRRYGKQKYAQVIDGERELLARHDNLTTVLLTLTGSTFPDGTPVRPVELMDSIKNAHSPVRDKLYYELKQKRGLNYEYAWVNGPTQRGKLGHDHLHWGLYLPKTVKAEAFEPAVDKFIEKCDLATAEQNPYDDAIQIETADEREFQPYGEDREKGCVTRLGRYLTRHLPGLGNTTDDVRERSVEFQRHSAMAWATGARTFDSSDIFSSDKESKSPGDSSDVELVAMRTEDGREFDVDGSGGGGPEMVDTQPLEEP